MNIFESNTDAFAINRGFYYQYLSLLKKWLENYINGLSEDIYSEVDDDIKQVGEETTFTQVKCYTRHFSFQSKEVRQSLFNFFILFFKNQENTKTLFRYVTNTGISKNEKLLRAWCENPKLQDKDLVDAILKKIKVLLRKEINKKKVKKLAKKGIDQSEIQEINLAANELLKFCNEKTSLIKFIKTIKWEFLELDPKAAVKNLNIEIDNLLLGEKFKERSTYFLKAVLLSEIYNCSQEFNEEDRRLSNHKLNNLLNKADEDLQSHINRDFIKSIHYFNDLIDQKIKNSYGSLDQRISAVEKITGSKRVIADLPKMLTLSPASYGKKFYGSAKFIKEFQTKINSQKRISISGKTGTGKSLFLQHFIDENKDQFDHIIYINGSPDISKAFSLDRVLIENLNIKIGRPVEGDELFLMICNELSRIEGNNICVIDDYTKDVKNLKILYSLYNWNLVIISQEELIGLDSEKVKLPTINFSVAKKIYERYSQINVSDKILNQFFQVIDFNPSIIELSSKLIDNSIDFTIETLLDAFSNGKEIEMLNLDISVSDEENPVQFLSYLYRKLLPQNLIENEIHLLNFIALLPYEDIKIKDLARICGEEHYKTNIIEITNKVNTLHRKGILEKDRNNLKISRLLQELIIFKEKQTGQNYFMGSILWIIWLYKRIDEVSQSDPTKSYKYLKYAESILTRIQEPFRESLFQPLLLLENALLNAYSWQETYNDLHTRWVGLGQRALSYLGEDDGNLGVILNNVALSYSNQNDAKIAIELYKKAIDTFTKVVKYDTTDMLINTYSNLFFTMTYFSESQGLDSTLKTVRNIIKKSEPDQNIAFIAAFHNTEAFYFKEKNENEKALESYEKAISCYKKLPDSNRNNLYFIAFYFSALELIILKGEHKKVETYLIEISKLRKKIDLLEKSKPLPIFEAIDLLNSLYIPDLNKD